MLTEEQARTLLHEAGDTIEVRPDPDLPQRARRDRRHRRFTTMAAAAVAVAVVGAGTTYALSSDPGSSAGPAGPAGSPTMTQSPPRDLVTVPDVAGSSEDLARKRLAQLGFTVTVVREESCAPVGSVLAQEPAAGSTVEWDEQVQLTVATTEPTGSCLGGTVSPVDAKVADAFVSFAQRSIPRPPPSAPKVAIGLGGKVHKYVDAADLSDRSTWVLDAPYAQRTGPFSALELIAEQQGKSVRDFTLTSDLTTATRTTCTLEPASPPASFLRQGHVLSIQPPEAKDRPCLDWWSVDLTYDDAGLTGVFLVLGEP